MPARTPFALGAALALLVALPALARADVREVGCTELQSAVKAAGETPETIVLDGMCTISQLGGAVDFPSGSNLVLRGAPGTMSGIDGEGEPGELLWSGSARSLSIEDLTLENSVGYGSAHLVAGQVTIAGDSFLGNTSSRPQGAGLFVIASGPGCPAAGGSPAITVRESTFAGNTLTYTGESSMGAGAFLGDGCPGAGAVLDGNTFVGNVLRAENAEYAYGAGVFLGTEGEASASATQAGNVFAGNRVELVPAVHAYNGGSFGGGGEWLAGMSLTSARDRFSSNSVSGSTGARPSGGAGLGLGTGGDAQNAPCAKGAPATATLQDDVLAGNAILGGTPAGAAGAAIQVGCSEGEGDALALRDSTVTANSAPATAVAGVAGQPGEALTIANSIVYGDSGGAELGGFTGSPGVSYSDICAAGSSAPIAGAGNICAAPQLAGPPGDVHETAASPTRQAGSNALVPAGLATDLYGAPRIAGGSLQPTCGEGYVPLAGPVVDMGAAQDAELLVPTRGLSCPPLFRRSSFTFPAVSVLPGGVLLLRFRGLTKGTLIAKAAIPERKTVVIDVHGRRRRVTRSVIVAYGGMSRVGPLAPLLNVRLVPSRKALATLRRHRRLTLSLTITYAADRLFPATQTHAIHVRWIAPRRG
jgi:hypothetical protein